MTVIRLCGSINDLTLLWLLNHKYCSEVVLKFQLVHHDTFYNGQNQQDSTECLMMLIYIINKGSMPDSSSTTYPMGASLSDILFSFVLEKYIFCDVCGPHLSLVTCCILHLLIPLPCKTWLYKGCNKNGKNLVLGVYKNTWHVESSCILQPPNYLLLFVNRFRCINNYVTKDRCSIPMDTTVMLGHLKFSLHDTIDHHGPSIHSSHYTASINCCKNTLQQR